MFELKHGYIWALPFLFVLASCDYKYSNYEIPDSPRQGTINLQSSLATIEEAIDSNPGISENYFRKAILLHNAPKPGAWAAISKAIKLERNNPQYHFLASKILAEAHQNDRALEHALRAEILGYRFPDLYLLLAELNYRTRYFGKGLLYINKALSLNADKHENYYIKGLLFLAIGDTVEGQKYLGQSIAIKANKPAYNAVIDIYRDLGNYDTAFYLLNKNLEANPGDPKLLFRKGELNQDTGDLEAAEMIFKELLDIEYPKYLIYNQLSIIKALQNQLDSSDYFAHKSLETRNDFKDALLTLARNDNRRENYRGAIEKYEQVLAVDSTYQIAKDELEKLRRKVAYLRLVQKQMAERPKIELLAPKKVVDKSENEPE